MKIELSLTVEQVNSILVALGHRPYFESADLIQKIKMDAEQQIGPKPLEVTEE